MVIQVGRRIKDLRIERELTQDQLAAMMGISRSTLGMYETGRREPDLETCEAFADIFNVDIDYLMGRSSIPCRDPIPQHFAPTTKEVAMLKKYRALDPRGQSAVLATLEHEYQAMQTPQDNSVPSTG